MLSGPHPNATRYANNVTTTAYRKVQTTDQRVPYGAENAVRSICCRTSASVGLCFFFCVFLKNDVPHHPLVEQIKDILSLWQPKMVALKDSQCFLK